jgi:alkylated DNA repair dioxygenase AlkB
MHLKHADLFGAGQSLPAGFRYEANLIDASEEQVLLDQIGRLAFKQFQFQGFLGKRRVVSFGWRYDFNGGGLSKADDMPAFLLAIRQRASAFAGVASSDLQQVLVTEYTPGAAIGWHKDRSVFGDVVGVSLLAPCTFRFRRKKEAGWDRVNTKVEPRSVYLLRGPSRSEWEHSIPAVDGLRYSLTFRNVLELGA